MGLYFFSEGLFIFIKAEVAQILIANAWQKNLSSEKNHTPWPWADTHPIAELIIKDKNWYVLAGANGRNLAFAPTHLSSSSNPGQPGNSIIFGHRDTQFKILQSLKMGDLIKVKTKQKQQTYQVMKLRIAHQSQVNIIQNISDFVIKQPKLTLVTCYPFNNILPNPTHRYIVQAMAI